jgi:hypothetical protein
MDNLLRLKDLKIIDTHLLWGDNVLSTEVNNCIFLWKPIDLTDVLVIS